MIELPDPKLNQTDLAPCVRICVLAMSVAIGRKIAFSRSYDVDVHNCLETYGNIKTEEITERMSSNLMSEFRGSNLDYVLIVAIQESRQLKDFILSKHFDPPNALFEHLAYLTINSDRLNEIAFQLELVNKTFMVTLIRIVKN